MTEQEARAEALRRWPDDETLSEETRDGLMATRYGFEAGVVWERSRRSSRRVEAAPSDTDHSCESCEDCLHDGNKCCGCYDGVCCQEVPSTPEQEEERNE